MPDAVIACDIPAIAVCACGTTWQARTFTVSPERHDRVHRLDRCPVCVGGTDAEGADRG